MSKYVGTGKARPPLNTLGGTRWAKTKEQAERAVLDVAGELLSIQAARETQEGHSFPVDTAWQREFEGSFCLRSNSGSNARHCGNESGHGAPETDGSVDLWRCRIWENRSGHSSGVQGGNGRQQVAVLVPTTVLAQQHYNTFRERMADYPVRVELLSRFRTRRMQQKVVEGLAGGAVDIVIGTHRLIQNDIVFKDLGPGGD